MKNPQPSKSIFFEANRNNISIQEIELDFIEELYSQQDNRIGKLFAMINGSSKEELEDNLEFISLLSFYVDSLYWRLPYFDDVTAKIIADNSGHTVLSRINNRHGSILKRLSPEDRQLLVRATIPLEFATIRQKFDTQSIFYKIYESKKINFLLSDLPFLDSNTNRKFQRYIHQDLVLPLSSHKIYISLTSSEYLVDGQILHDVNTLLMLQSKEYCSCADRDTLRKYVDLRNYLAKDTPFGIGFYRKAIRQRIFSRINQSTTITSANKT